MTLKLDFDRFHTALGDRSVLRFQGRVAQVIGLSIEVEGLRLAVGDVCTILPETAGRRMLHGTNASLSDRRAGGISAEVVGFRDNRLIVMPFSDTQGVRPGSAVFPRGRAFNVPVGPSLLGRVIDGMAQPIDGLGPLGTIARYPVTNQPPDPLSRRPIRERLSTGVRAIDGMLTCGKGQRIGIFAGSGVGKSTALGMIARNAQTHVNVIALIGERGREVQEFMERDLGPEGLARSVVVVATSDQPALQRIKAAWVATAIAEYFRSQGRKVLLLIDSLTRVAHAQREIGLSLGEPPTVKGYPPSALGLIPRLVERAGADNRTGGSITALYTVLADGDDADDPIVDAARAIVDGHILLSRSISEQGTDPASAVGRSLSRVMADIATPEHMRAATAYRGLWSAYEENRDLILMGAYAGGDPLIDEAIARRSELLAFLKQAPDERTAFDSSLEILMKGFAK
jgi:FliI/YscN family ATPase